MVEKPLRSNVPADAIVAPHEQKNLVRIWCRLHDFRHLSRSFSSIFFALLFRFPLGQRALEALAGLFLDRGKTRSCVVVLVVYLHKCLLQRVQSSCTT